MNKQVYVSITGLKLHSRWHTLRFWRHAIPAMVQARRARGNISASARTIDGINHTLTVWESAAAAKRYVHTGAHRKARAAFHSIGTGLTCGYLTERVPTWAEVPDLWRTHGRIYGDGLNVEAGHDPEQPAQTRRP
ncbi:MAG: hypothetical protein AAFR04_13700 [Pseudomonadota bacterium]